MKFKFRHADKIVGAFTLLAILFICFMLIMVGKNKRWFQEDTFYQTEFLTADSLKVGMAIKLRGFVIGEIREFDLTEDNLVNVKFVIYEEYLEKVTPGSVLELNNSPLGGGLNFYPGINPGDHPPALSYIPSTQFPEGRTLLEEGLVDKPEQSDIITELMASVPTLLEDIDKTVVTVNDLLYTVDKSLEGDPNAGPVSDLLVSTADVAEVLAVEIEDILQDINLVTGSLAQLTSELEDPENLLPRLAGQEGLAGAVFSDQSELYISIYAILEEITVSLNNVAALTGSLSELSPQIALLLEETTATLDEAGDVLEGLKNNPLLRGGVSEEEDPVEPVGADIRDSEF